MSVYEKMTAIADKIRGLLGLSDTMGLDAMATNLGTVQTNVANAFAAISNRGGTLPSSQISDNLASAINSIPEGVTIQTKTGSYTTNNMGAATVNCGFKPDVVVLSASGGAGSCYSGAAFTEYNTTTASLLIVGSTTSYAYANHVLTRTSTGFSVSAKRYSTSFQASNEGNRTVNYVAIKYTE